MIRIALALLLAQGSPDDPPLATALLDSGAKMIAGYKGGASPVGDAAFLERLMADLVDAKPTDAELKAFVGDADPKKRAKKINQLLDDPRFGTFWADRFATVLFGDLSKVRFQGIGPLGDGVEAAIVAAFRLWLADRLRKDAPWTETVFQILDARGSASEVPALAYKLSLTRESGTERAFTESASRHFLGIRLACARCHDHPFDKWRVEDYYGFGAFIVRQRARLRNGVPTILYADEGELMMPVGQSPRDSNVKMAGGGIAAPNFLFGGTAGKNDDRMTVLANFMTQKSNTQLPRALANRVWSWLFGWGVVHPIDDFNLRNKALSPPLLEAMMRDLVDNRYSLKHLVRAICNTQEYQLPTLEQVPEAVAFRHLARNRFGLGPLTLDYSKQRPSVEVTLPNIWLRVRPRFGGSPSKFMYRLPDSKDPTRHAVLQIYDGKSPEMMETILHQFENPKTATSVMEGKSKVTLSEVSGSYGCGLGWDGPLNFAMVFARVDFPTGAIATFKLEGPADVVANLREAFLAAVQSASPR